MIKRDKKLIAIVALTFSSLCFAQNKDSFDLATVNNIAKIYKDGGKFNKNEKTSFELYLLSAESGNVDAKYEVSTMFANGIGVNQDYEQAYKWLSLAAQGGHSKAIESLGAMYAAQPKPLFNPVIVEKTISISSPKQEREVTNIVDLNFDDSNTFQLLDFAVQSFEEGNYKQALITFNLFANAPYYHPMAQYYAGLIYEKKDSGLYNISRAYQMFKESAEQNNADALYKMGVYLLEGKFVSQNKNTAFTTFLKAAEQGSPSAKYMLGYSFEFAQGTPANMVEAYKWYYIGAKALNKKSINGKNRLQHRMPPADIKTAKSMAHQWINNYPNDFNH